jgi:hypothetical protein
LVKIVGVAENVGVIIVDVCATVVTGCGS